MPLNCSITWFTLDPNGDIWSPMMGAITHLPMDLITNNIECLRMNQLFDAGDPTGLTEAEMRILHKLK